MDYGRFIELLGRFFERAGTVLHMRGEHYTAEEGSPACIIIDESRNTYYITEIGLPPDIPSTDDILRTAIHEYSNTNDIDPFILRLFAVLGEDIKVSRFRGLDDPGLDTERLQKKSALVVIDEKVPDVTAFADSMGLDYQTVPLKGIFTIYFFSPSASDEIEALYNKVSDVDESYLENGPKEQDGLSLPSTDNLSLRSPVVPEFSSQPEASYNPQPAEPEGGFASDRDEDTEQDNKVVKTTELQPVSAVSEPEKVNSFYTNLGQVAGLLYSFFLFAPAFLLSKITRGRVPEGAAYLFGAVCAFVGLYYYPVKIGLEGFTGAMLNYSGDVVRHVIVFTQNISTTLYDLMPVGHASVVETVGSLAVYILSFDAVLLEFMNSHYYLQYLIVFAFIIAIVPAFRIFGRRMICFSIALYMVYIPVFIIGHWSVAAATTNFIAPAEYSAELVFMLARSICGSLVISLLIPLLAVLLAIKLCRGIKNGL